jgi:uncharacterized membrane protein/uncharacterized protein YwbE
MNRVLTSVALGAAAIYFFDPQAGRRRRARARDKIEHTRRQLHGAYDVTVRDVQHRAQGLQSMVRRLVRREERVADETLVGRVRAILGRYVSHPHAIAVSAQDGHVALSGPILAHEVPRLLSAVKHVAGARGVENQLEMHQEASHVSSLQGGVPRRGQRFELLQDNWAPATRLVVGAAGLLLWIRGGLIGRTGGAALFLRAMTNLNFASLVGIGHPGEGIQVHKSICVNAPVERVFAFWSDVQNFPHFMSNVYDVQVMEDRSQWLVSGPAGMLVGWTSELVRVEPNALIEWRSSEDSTVKQAGCVHFEPLEGGITRVSVDLRYLPPGGALGHAVASLFGADPKSEMDADLMRMKSMIETGKRPHDAAQPA